MLRGATRGARAQRSLMRTFLLRHQTETHFWKYILKDILKAHHDTLAISFTLVVAWRGMHWSRRGQWGWSVSVCTPAAASHPAVGVQRSRMALLIVVLDCVLGCSRKTKQTIIFKCRKSSMREQKIACSYCSWKTCKLCQISVDRQVPSKTRHTYLCLLDHWLPAPFDQEGPHCTQGALLP